MRKMKRGLSLVLASIMATALVGCSGGENTETTNTATTTENKETTGTTQAADENQEEITLRFVSMGAIMESIIEVTSLSDAMSAEAM